jgi:hypothetical protein
MVVILNSQIAMYNVRYCRYRVEGLARDKVKMVNIAEANSDSCSIIAILGEKRVLIQESTLGHRYLYG